MASLNSEFIFSYSGYFTYVKETNLPNYLQIKDGKGTTG